MGLIRKFIINCVSKEIQTNGITIGGYFIREVDGTLTIIRISD